MNIRSKIKKFTSSSKTESWSAGKKKNYSIFLFFSLVVLCFFLAVTAAGSHFLSMEARNGADFNIRNIQPLTSHAKGGELMSVEFNVYTRVPGIYRLKIFSPAGAELASEIKLVRAESPGIWKITSELEAEGPGRYEIELSGFLNKYENERYITYFWVERTEEREIESPEKAFPEVKGSTFQANESYADSGTHENINVDNINDQNVNKNVNKAGLEDENVNNENVTDEDVNEDSLGNKNLNNEAANSQDSNDEKAPENSGGQAGETGCSLHVSSLHVSSFPGGSSVYIDGILKGATPLNLTGLPKGSYELRLELEGYETEILNIRLEASEGKSVYRQLNKEYGWLAVNSSPENASVYIDGYSRGLTPLELELSSGEHQVKLVKEGCEDRTETVTLQGNETVSLNWILVDNSGPAYETGVLYVSSIPIGCTVYLNGHEIGTTPETLQNLPAGSYRLRLSLYGYESFETEIRVVPGETTSIYQPMVEIQREEKDNSPLITSLHIKAFIIFMIAGFLVYLVIYKLLKEM